MNTEKIFTPRNTVIFSMICIAALFRLIPLEYRMANFTPVGAIALFGGAFITNKKYAILLPLSVMFISDIILQITGQHGFHMLMPWVYGSFVLITLLGRFVQKLQRGYSSVVLTMVAPLFSSIIFFFISNFGVWVNGDVHTGLSLAQCYIDGIPFYKGTVLGDVFFTMLLFTSFSIIKWRYPMVAVN
ncbi:MAG: DUF6580 family putative transport protein [Bacteroidia bacterium]